MEPQERSESSTQLAADVYENQSIGQTSMNPLGVQSHHCTSQDQRRPRLTTDDWDLQQLEGTSLQLDFQDSHLSPALSLLPSSSAVQHNFTDYSLFQQSDLEFAPLRASPDISVASERFHLPPQHYTSQASEHGSLSQHPLAQTTVLSEDGASSCCSLSQHSMSPGDEGRQSEMVRSPGIASVDDGQGTRSFRNDADSKERDGQTLTDPPDKPVGQGSEDETTFLSGDIPARHLLELLQKDVGMPSGSSSAVSSASETSLKRAASFQGESKSAGISKPDIDQSTGRREGPPGEASLSQQQTQQPKRDLHPDKSHPRLSDVSNITIGSRNTQPDDSSEVLHRELLCEIGRRSTYESRSKGQLHGGPTPDYESLTPNPNETSKGKQSVTTTTLGGVLGTGLQFPAGYSVEQGHRERDLWSLGNQTGIDGSYLGFLPQSQSTPGVFNAPPKSSVKTQLGRLPAVESNMENSYQSNTGISPQPVVAVVDFEKTNIDAFHSGTAMPHQEETTSGKVQALPSLNYMQKVDAWRTNQISGKISLFDSLALQGFSGISPKKKAYDAVSDSLNLILSQQGTSVQRVPVPSATNQDVTQSSTMARSGSSSPRRGEAVGSAPNDKDDTGSAAWPSASPLGRSQSHSSLSTVVTSIQKAQKIERLAEKERSQTQEDTLQQPGTAIQPSPLMSLGRFSDVSLDRDMSGTLSNSQGSYNTGQNLAASIEASSVISLEVDNYAPYWNSKPSSPPPKPRELNIEERIPLYLYNLGIDQSPSTILTPFAPRGPIREPEFSPTDLCTIKGSIGTPTKSAQPSEGGSPHKGEFSRSSLLSVDSSMSIPLSVDSLCPAVSLPEHNKASPSFDTAASQSIQRMAPSSQPQEASYLPAVQPHQQQQRDSNDTSSQNTIQLGDKFDSGSSLVMEAKCITRNKESSLQVSHSMEQSTEDSFVGAKTLQEIRKLLGQAEDIVSDGSSMASSASSAVSRLHSDDDIFLSLRKKTGVFQDSSFTSSSTAGGHRTRSSLLWARSSSDSILISERLRESSIGRESMASSGQPDYPSTQVLNTAPAADSSIRPQDSMASGCAAPSFLLSKSARRAEPEGCSAAPPDNTGPVQPPVIKPSPAVSKPQPASSPTETAEEEEVAENPQGDPVESSSSSPILGDPEQGVMSDGSSESSLAVRVAKLLQSESPATVVSSTPSTADQEEIRAREWIKLKVSGQQCEPLELDSEDRQRIEEIKRELLLKNPMKSQGSTDTESSMVSSVGGPGMQAPPQPAETFTALRAAEDRLSHQLQCLNTNLFDSSVQLHRPLHQDLETRVREIAAREGLTLPRTNPPAITSITIATCRRSTSPSPSPSPAPPLSPAPESLHLSQLSTVAANGQLPPALDEEDGATSTQATPRETVSMSEPNSSLYTRDQTLDSQSAPWNQGRQDAVGGQYDQPPPSSLGLEGEDVKVGDNNTQVSWKRDLQGADDQGPDQPLSSNRYSSVSSVGHGAEQATGSSITDSPTRTGHISHLHLTLSPKAPDHSLTTGIQSSHAAALPGLQSKEFVPLRHSSSSTSSPDEGLCLSSPLESYETREPIRAPPHRLVASPWPLVIQTPAKPVLLPYKPHGSEELFYVPQTEADVSPTNCSDTTMESSHPGSDDAVPPCFSTEVLGNRDPRLDRGVTIKHTEGIYSKRLKTASFTMQAPGHRGASVAADGSSQTSVSQTPQPSSQAAVTLTRVSLSSNQGPSSSRRDQGTSPVQFLSYNQSGANGEAFQPVHMEMDYGTKSQHPNVHLDQSSVPRVGMEREQGRRDPDLTQPTSQQSGSALDQLWRRFSERWSLEESRPTNEREASLLERLERLSRLIHSTTGATSLSEQEEETYQRPYTTEQESRRRGEDAALKRRERKESIEEMERSVHAEAVEIRGRAERKVRGGRQVDGKPSIPRQAWVLEPQVEETYNPAEVDSSTSLSSSLSHGPSHSQHLCPAERDESETLSTMSSSMSTVDTARLIRAFGAHRVRHLKTASSLRKLYSTIDKQKDGREQRRGRGKDPPHIVTPSETTGTDDSIVDADSASSTSTYTLPSHRGPSQSLAAKKAVKLVSKGIQAGDLEIVSNGTRRHTRDVGTTFPSPSEARGPRECSSSSSSVERGRGGDRSPSKTHGFLKERKSKRSQQKHHPQGVSWFISAGDLRAEARKENQPEEEELAWRPSAAWFDPYSRAHPWREPLRQRQVQEDRNKPLRIIRLESDPEARSKTTSSGLVRISLQEALEMNRPEFISQSRERLKHLALQAEERKLQAIFIRERDELFNRPGGPGRLPRPAGTAQFRRAVPRREMIQRSKQIYENLPEVQRRRELERRKAEYRSYRLNAQLYNKKITNRVLGRRTPWQ